LPLSFGKWAEILIHNPAVGGGKMQSVRSISGKKSLSLISDKALKIPKERGKDA